MINSGNRCQDVSEHEVSDEVLKKVLVHLNLIIPLSVARADISLLRQAYDSYKRCKNCLKERNKVISCTKTCASFDRLTGEIYLSVSNCPFAKEIYKKEQYEILLKKLLLGKRFRSRTFETFIPRSGTEKALNFCKAWCKSFTANVNGIYICGENNGCGKTHLAVAILLELLNYGIAGAFTVVPNFLQELQASFGDHKEFIRIFNTYKKAEVLVLDDISAIRLDKNNRASEWIKEQIFLLLNYRYEWSLPTIITSNVDYVELQKIYGKRIVSRIIEMTDFIKNTATDYRLAALK